MTLDGTRTYVVGQARVAIIDPGPLLEEHMHAVAEAVGDGVVVSVLLTHAHPDHAEAGAELAARLNAPLLAGATASLHHDDVVHTDAGDIHAIATPGHTPDHFSFWWPAARAVFCGDLMMGGLDTALVAQPEGNLAEYLGSLRKLRALGPDIIYPAHGEPFSEPAAAIDSYIAHRDERVAQVVSGLSGGPLSTEALLDRVYGAGLDPRLRAYAESALEAYLVYLQAERRVQQSSDGVWSLT